MADQDGDPAEDLDLDPPVETGDEEDVEQQDQQAEEQDEEPEGDDVDASAEPRPDVGAQRQPSRGERRQQVLSNELREARQREADLNRRLDALIANQRQPAQQGESPDARAQRLALLTPEERIREELQVAQQGFAREQQALRFAVIDGNDRAAFEAKAMVDPVYASMRDKVEVELRNLRNQGQTVEREKLMDYLAGKEMREKREAARKRGDFDKQRAQGARRVQSQQARASNSGSDVSANRRDRNSSLERRLENQSL